MKIREMWEKVKDFFTEEDETEEKLFGKKFTGNELLTEEVIEEEKENGN